MGVWNDLLASFAASKAPTKSVLLLGGSTKSQNAFVDQLYLDEESFLTPTVRNQKANGFGLGYTFIQYRDESGELLSTLQVYSVLGDYEDSHKLLIQSIFKSLILSDTLIIPLLDFKENPHNWIRSLKSWISIIDESFPLTERPTSSSQSKEVNTIPLGARILVAVVNTETRPDWEFSKFETIQVFLRVISLIHGFGLIYSSLLRPDQRIPQLVSAMLKIQITQKVLPKLEPNMVDHTEILVPTGIDTLGKIKTINDDIDPLEIVKKYDFMKIADDDFTGQYEDLIPRSHTKPVGKDNNAIDDSQVKVDISYQEFLTKLYDKRNTSQEGILKNFIQNVKQQPE